MLEVTLTRLPSRGAPCSAVSSVNPLAEPMDSMRRSAPPLPPPLHADAAEAAEEGGTGGGGGDVSRWYRALSTHDARCARAQRAAEGHESEAGSDGHTHDLRVSPRPDPARGDMGSQWKAGSLLATCSVASGAAVYATVVAMAGCTQAFSTSSTQDSDRRLPPGLLACPSSETYSDVIFASPICCVTKLPPPARPQAPWPTPSQGVGAPTPRWAQGQ